MAEELTAPATTEDGSESISSPGIAVAVIDQHEVVHAGIDAWCGRAEPPISVVDSFHSSPELLARYPTVPSQVDIVVFDVFLDDARPAFGALRELCQAGHRVIVYSRLSTDEVILTCLDMGSATYLAKTEGQRHLIAAIQAVHAGEVYWGPQMAQAVANDRVSGRTNLSEREKEVLVTWFQTESKELVSSRLHIAPATVRTHLQRVRAKYAAVGRPAPTKTALLARAIEDGILSLSDL